MGYSLRQAAFMKQRAAQRHAERLAREAEHAKAVAEFRAAYWDRHKVAGALGISLHTLKRWQMAGKGPQPLKMGDSPKSRTLWEAADVLRYLRSPAEYERAKRGD